MYIRPPIFAEKFYPKNKEILKYLIKTLLDEAETLDIPKENICSGIVPHAAYLYSGLAAAYFYKHILNNFYDTIIILGVNHTGIGDSICIAPDLIYTTPFGYIKNDFKFLTELAKKPYIENNIEPHLYEHSIEVQLPFLQYIFKKRLKIVPILLKNLDIHTALKLIQDIIDISKKLDRKILLLVSSDFTHHGEMYGYNIFNDNINYNVKKLDKLFIDTILRKDENLFLTLVKEYNATICGVSGILCYIIFSKIFNLENKLLIYYTSADITGDEDIIVGYASIAGYFIE